MVFNRVHHKSYKWLNNDLHVGHVTQCELGRRHSRLISCLGQLVINTMVGMDKISSSAWERIIKQIKINSLSIVAMLQGLDQI